MCFFNIKRNGIRDLLLKGKWKEYLGLVPYNHSHSENGNISYYDWWHTEANNDWFNRYINYNFPENNAKINFYSVFGNNTFIKKNIQGKKIFYTAESIKKEEYCLNIVDLALGYEIALDDKLVYFPCWILYLLKPEHKEKDILNMINRINKQSANAIEDAVLIARHDKFGTRKMITDKLNQIVRIKYAGKWKNNTTALWNQYGDDKIKYLSNFKFNICPENSNKYGYVTEKIFQAFQAGTVPIYFGSDNNPEPQIINKNRVIFWDEKNIKGTIGQIMELKNSEKKYKDFASQPKFSKDAGEILIDRLKNFKIKIEEIIG